jgi:hypothetical protein
MDMSVTVLKDLIFDIDIDAVLRLSGYSERRPAPKAVAEKAETMRTRCLELARPRAVYEIYDIAGWEGRSVRLDGTTLSGAVLKKVLSGSDRAVVFVNTLGTGVEDEVGRLSSDGDMFTSVILDTMGSIALGMLFSDFTTKILSHEANAQNYALTQPFGPGECRWDITEQRTLFTLVDADAVGVTLTDSCLMIPKKSRSGIMGLGPADSISREAPCDLCERQNCPGRDMLDIMRASL